jgi:hypothetical protein
MKSYLEVLERVTSFIFGCWRLMTNKSWKKVYLEAPFCDQCIEENETILYMLRGCSYALALLNVVPTGLR